MFIGVGELVDAALVPAAEEVGAKEGGDAGLGHFAADQPRAQCKHVGVVVLACELRRERIVDARAAAARIAVHGDRDPDAGAADGDATVRFSKSHFRRELGAILRVVDAFGAVGPEVGDVMALLAQPGGKLVLELVTGMVGVVCDAQGLT